MTDVFDFPIREVFPDAELSSFAWLSGLLPVSLPSCRSFARILRTTKVRPLHGAG